MKRRARSSMRALKALAKYYDRRRAKLLPVEKCKHARWEVSGWRGGGKERLVSLRCDGCGLEYERKATGRERACSPDLWEDKSPVTNIHYVWHKFCEEVLMAKTEANDRLRGYELSLLAEKFAARFPRHVRVTSCDDSHHSSSVLVLIEHQARRKYMGTTVVYIPQNGPVGEDRDGARFAQFFLYGGHRWELIETLKQIHMQAIKRGKLERKAQNARHQRLKRALRVPSEAELAQAALAGKLRLPTKPGKKGPKPDVDDSKENAP